MKLHFISTLLSSVFAIGNAFAQEKSNYLDTIAIEACTCSSKITDATNLTMKFGLCMIQAAAPYSEELEKDHGIKMSEMDQKGGEQLGSIIAMRMVSHCPDVITKLSGQITDTDQTEENYETQFHESEGTIVKIDKEQFLVFSIKESTGKVKKYYWMNFVESSMNLETEYNALHNKKVSFSYQEWELFDAKIGEYRLFNVLSSLEKIK